MTDTNTDPLADPSPAPAAPAANDAGTAADAQELDDLDALLSEYSATEKAADLDAEAEPPAQQEQPVEVDTMQLIAHSYRDMQRQQAALDARDGKEAVEAIRGDINSAVYPNEMVEGWIKSVGEKDPAIKEAWQNRYTDPHTYTRTVDRLSRRFYKEFGKLPDNEATNDRAAVAEAVRGASTRAPEPQAKNFGRMSDGEFAAEKDKLFGG